MLNMRITINRNLQAKTPKKKRLTDWICTHGTDPRARPTLAGPSQPEKQEKRPHTWLFLLLIEITSWRLFTFFWRRWPNETTQNCERGRKTWMRETDLIVWLRPTPQSRHALQNAENARLGKPMKRQERWKTMATQPTPHLRRTLLKTFSTVSQGSIQRECST